MIRRIRSGARVSAPRPHTVPFLTVLFAALVMSVLAGVSAANPLPTEFVFVNVQPWQDGFCATNPITECAQVQQYSTAEGDVEFDLYIHPYFWFFGPMTSFHFDVNWPSGWQYTSFESCLGGTVQETRYSNHTVVQVGYDPAIQPAETMLLVGRIRMNVQGFGELDFATIGYNGDMAAVSHAQAGVQNCFCETSCAAFTDACGVIFSPHVLNIDVPRGQRTESSFYTILSYNDHDGPCPTQFVEEEPWLQLIPVQLGAPWEISLRVLVDASNLEDGIYQAEVRGEATCHMCATVVVHVLTTADQPEPSTRLESWGGIKSIYRSSD